MVRVEADASIDDADCAVPSAGTASGSGGGRFANVVVSRSSRLARCAIVPMLWCK